MVTNKQRRRQLARAKYERQQQRRTVGANRRRTIGLVVGVIVALVTAGLLVWLILYIVDEERDQNPEVPTPTAPFSTELPTPTDDVPQTTGPGTGGTSTEPSDQPTPETPTETS